MDETQERAREVLEFWFDPGIGAGVAGCGGEARARPEWFVKDRAFDLRIAERFGTLITAALAGDCAHWLAAARSALACVIVLDQFTRNVYRDTPRAFAGDEQALGAARGMVAADWDRQLAPLERWFCYLPFEHSENLADQRESLRLFGSLRDDPLAGGSWEWALRHHEVIARYGRFPHRNAILGRESTARERAFLEQPGSSF